MRLLPIAFGLGGDADQAETQTHFGRAEPLRAQTVIGGRLISFREQNSGMV